jgi:AraC family transcriptional regulator
MLKGEAQAPSARLIAAGADWRVTEFVCDAGPDDRPFEERHDYVNIAGVLSGSFKYRTHSGDSLMHPGGFVLGEAGRCYECGHEHGRGDRCIAFGLSPAYFDEIAHAAVGATGFSFAIPALPAAAGLLPLAARIATLDESDALAVEDTVVRLAFAAATAASGRKPDSAPVSARDEKRIASTMRYIDDHTTEAIDLDRLAAIAALSKFHFLRVFARVAGVSPYRYLINVRLRRAAVEIATSERRISEIAYEAGFGDLSTFNSQFRIVFGASPSAWRRGEDLP